MIVFPYFESLIGTSSLFLFRNCLTYSYFSILFYSIFSFFSLICSFSFSISWLICYWMSFRNLDLKRSTIADFYYYLGSMLNGWILPLSRSLIPYFYLIGLGLLDPSPLKLASTRWLDPNLKACFYSSSLLRWSLSYLLCII